LFSGTSHPDTEAQSCSPNLSARFTGALDDDLLRGNIDSDAVPVKDFGYF
jgi:hypothetical protein